MQIKWCEAGNGCHYAHQLFEAFVQTALNQDVYLEGKKRRQSL